MDACRSETPWPLDLLILSLTPLGAQKSTFCGLLRTQRPRCVTSSPLGSRMRNFRPLLAVLYGNEWRTGVRHIFLDPVASQMHASGSPSGSSFESDQGDFAPVHSSSARSPWIPPLDLVLSRTKATLRPFTQVLLGPPGFLTFPGESG